MISKDEERFSRLLPYVIAFGIVIITGIVLLVMGRVPICVCGTIKLWHGVVFSSENSQHVTDWYTFTHVLHGILFYALLWWLKPGWSAGQRFVAAVAIESAWEIAENTPLIIDRYRAATISLDYYGDSVLNSLSDIAAMAVGFALAAVIPVWASVALVVVVEAGLAYAIRDNLLLNILMLVHPLDAVKAWQAAGS
jgi:Protein of unknown function (DUF2585)